MLALEVSLFTNMYDYFTTVTKITVWKNMICTLMIFIVLCFDIYNIC
jgi:hypothetical protein